MEDLRFGCVLAIADVIGVVKVHNYSQSYRIHLVAGRFPTAYVQHKHILGPIGWLLDNIRVLPQPLPWKGEQGLWQINDGAIAKALCASSSASTAGATTASGPRTTAGFAESLFEGIATSPSSEAAL